MAQIRGGADWRRWQGPPSLDDIKAIAEDCLAHIPERFRAALGGVAVHVVDFPDEDIEEDMGLESPFDLLGLYQGTDIGQKEGVGTPQDVDRILLFRRPILDYWCEEGEDLGHVVRHVLIHEIGHHLGLSDEDMERIEDEAG